MEIGWFSGAWPLQMIARAGRFVTSVARHAVPVGGVFARDWHPVTAIGVYWLESVLLALVAGFLCGHVKRLASPGEIKAAGVEPRDVLLFHLGSLFIFGGFLSGVLLILVGNGHIERPRWGELRDGAEVMLVVIAAGFLFDLWSLNRFTVAEVQARVDASNSRWALFWLLGFFGTFLMVFTGRATMFVGFFSVLKVTFESWAQLSRLFGWRSLKDRAADPVPPV